MERENENTRNTTSKHVKTVSLSEIVDVERNVSYSPVMKKF